MPTARENSPAKERVMQARFGSYVVRLGLIVLMVGCTAANAQQVIRMSPTGEATSLKWTTPEREYFSPIWSTQVVTNVSQPTLTVYAPAQGTANGTAIIVAPGGAFHALSINSEGID